MSADLREFLSEIGLSELFDQFVSAGIDLDVIDDLSGADFRELGVSLGDQKRIERARRTRPATAGVIERRLLSLLFIDLAGSTEMSVRMDPEDYRHLMFAYQTKCKEILVANGGHLARKFGDGILAYFGFPQMRETDTRRAAEAALQIVREVPLLVGQEELAVRIGIATGLTLIDEHPGDEGRERGQVFGEAPNLAARLQSIASPNSVVVCEATTSVLADHFDLHFIGKTSAQRAAGACQTVSGCRCRRWTNRTSGIASTAAILNSSPRSERSSNAWSEVKEGTGRAVLLEGGPGVGKSSLVGHIADLLVQDEAAILYWSCDLDQRGRALHPVASFLKAEIEQIRVAAHLTETDATGQWIARYCPHVDGAAQLIGSILQGGFESGAATDSLGSRVRLFELLDGYLDRLQETAPVALIVEDVHWIDPTTLEFLGEFGETLQSRRILLLLVQRASEPVRFSKSVPLSRITLEPLDDATSRKILDRELASLPAPKMLKDQIIARCEGIPLYLEEVARAVVERNAGEGLALAERTFSPHRGDLPTSLLGPLLSRLDSRQGARELASVAATIGRRFSVRMLRRLVARDDAEIGRVLEDLVSAQILRKLGSSAGGSLSLPTRLCRTRPIRCF